MNVTDAEMIVALLEHLADQEVGVWHAAGEPYETTDTGLFYGAIGTTPDRAVALARYDRDDYVPGDGYAFKTRRVQAMVRGRPGSVRDADDLADAVDGVLQGLRVVAGIDIVVRLNGPNPLGTDGNRRSELSLNYTVTLED